MQNFRAAEVGKQTCGRISMRLAVTNASKLILAEAAAARKTDAPASVAPAANLDKFRQQIVQQLGGAPAPLPRRERYHDFGETRIPNAAGDISRTDTASSDPHITTEELQDRNAKLQAHATRLGTTFRALLLFVVHGEKERLQEQCAELEADIEADIDARADASDAAGAEDRAAMEEELLMAHGQLRTLAAYEQQLLSQGLSDEPPGNEYEPFGGGSPARLRRDGSSEATRAERKQQLLLEAMQTLLLAEPGGDDGTYEEFVMGPAGALPSARLSVASGGGGGGGGVVEAEALAEAERRVAAAEARAEAAEAAAVAEAAELRRRLAAVELRASALADAAGAATRAAEARAEAAEAAALAAEAAVAEAAEAAAEATDAARAAAAAAAEAKRRAAAEAERAEAAEAKAAAAAAEAAAEVAATAEAEESRAAEAREAQQRWLRDEVQKAEAEAAAQAEAAAAAAAAEAEAAAEEEAAARERAEVEAREEAKRRKRLQMEREASQLRAKLGLPTTPMRGSGGGGGIGGDGSPSRLGSMFQFGLAKRSCGFWPSPPRDVSPSTPSPSPKRSSSSGNGRLR